MQATLRSPAEFESGERRNQGTMDPGTFGVAYDELRRIGYAEDGMALACARFEGNYSDIVNEWSGHTGSTVDFWETHFKPVDQQVGQEAAALGVGIREYGATVLKELVRSPYTDQGPDIGMAYDTPTPGGRFGIHGYYWDTYHALKAHMADANHQPIIDAVDGMESLIQRFGFVPNGTAFFYGDRSQMPYFSHSVRMLSEVFGDEALTRYLPAMQKEYDYWMQDANNSAIRLADGSVLNRYWSSSTGPRLESHYEDVTLATDAHTQLGRNPARLYKDIRAAAASGWDFSSRWLADGVNLSTINTTDILPIDLNSMLAYTEEALSMAHYASGNTLQAEEFLGRYTARINAINTYLWNPAQAVYRDYNFVTGHQTTTDSAAMVTPLYVGVAGKEQALGVADFVREHLLKEGGVIATTTETGQQWDAPNVWAPPNWQAARGFARAASEVIGLTSKEVELLLGLSEEVRSSFLHGFQEVFDKTGRIPEKTNGLNPGRQPVDGEYPTVKVLGMSVAVRHALETWHPRLDSECLPLGKRLSAQRVLKLTS